jgi:hypothetical protein
MPIGRIETLIPELNEMQHCIPDQDKTTGCMSGRLPAVGQPEMLGIMSGKQAFVYEFFVFVELFDSRIKSKPNWEGWYVHGF